MRYAESPLAGAVAVCLGMVCIPFAFALGGVLAALLVALLLAAFVACVVVMDYREGREL